MEEDEYPCCGCAHLFSLSSRRRSSEKLSFEGRGISAIDRYDSEQESMNFYIGWDEEERESHRRSRSMRSVELLWITGMKLQSCVDWYSSVSMGSMDVVSLDFFLLFLLSRMERECRGRYACQKSFLCQVGT